MKGFVFIYGSEIILRFLASGAFRMLDSRYDLTYVVLRSEDLLSEKDVYRFLSPESHKVRCIPFYPERFKQWNEQFDISCILYQERSRSFAVRYQERSKVEPERFASLAEKARPGEYERQREAIEEEIGLHPDLLDLTLRERPDFFILPSALIDYLTDDVLQIADKLNIPTLMLVAGWDNLSSKGLLYHHPTMMGVWGEQSKQHAMQVQGANPEDVYIVGSPHYESYYPAPDEERMALRAQLRLPVEKRILLFAGTVRLFDETQLLREIDEAIETGSLPDMHVLYRPHPWRDSRQHEDSFFNYSWRHITMDAEMELAYSAAKGASQRGSGSDNFMRRLDHLVQLYTAVDGLISPMSTVLLEALLFGLPTMAVAFSDGKHSWSADKVSQMTHFKELYDIPGLLVCRKRDDFFPQLIELVSRIGDEEFGRSLQQSTNFFVYRDRQSSYAERAALLVEQMLAGVAGPPFYDVAKVKAGKRYRMQNLTRELIQHNAVARTGLRFIQNIRQRISR